MIQAIVQVIKMIVVVRRFAPSVPINLPNKPAIIALNNGKNTTNIYI